MRRNATTQGVVAWIGIYKVDGSTSSAVRCNVNYSKAQLRATPKARRESVLFGGVAHAGRSSGAF
jgi:hypothetical protein